MLREGVKTQQVPLAYPGAVPHTRLQQCRGTKRAQINEKGVAGSRQRWRGVAERENEETPCALMGEWAVQRQSLSKRERGWGGLRGAEATVSKKGESPVSDTTEPSSGDKPGSEATGCAMRMSQVTVTKAGMTSRMVSARGLATKFQFPL